MRNKFSIWKGVIIVFAFMGAMLMAYHIITAAFLHVGWRSWSTVARTVTGHIFGIEGLEGLYRRQINIDDFGQIINDTFYLPEECVVDLWINLPDLSEKNLDGPIKKINKAKISGPKELIASTKLYLLDADKKPYLIAYDRKLKSQPVITRPLFSHFNIARYRLLPGDYLVKVELPNKFPIPISGLTSFEVFHTHCKERRFFPDSIRNLNLEVSEKRKKIAELAMANSYPKISEPYKASIRKGKVLIGMTPFEAVLAGGDFEYSLYVDPSVWTGVYNDLDVLWEQSYEPDGSLISLRFQNRTQFPNESLQSFWVEFNNGLVSRIGRGVND